MIISAILSVVFLFMAAYSIAFVRQRSIRLLLCAGYLAGIVFVWVPDLTTRIAQAVGIGRGLDLFLILLSVAILNALVMMSSHLNAQHRALTRLARHIALREAETPPADSEGRLGRLPPSGARGD